MEPDKSDAAKRRRVTRSPARQINNNEHADHGKGNGQFDGDAEHKAKPGADARPACFQNVLVRHQFADDSADKRAEDDARYAQEHACKKSDYRPDHRLLSGPRPLDAVGRGNIVQYKGQDGQKAEEDKGDPADALEMVYARGKQESEKDEDRARKRRQYDACKSDHDKQD